MHVHMQARMYACAHASRLSQMWMGNTIYAKCTFLSLAQEVITDEWNGRIKAHTKLDIPVMLFLSFLAAPSYMNKQTVEEYSVCGIESLWGLQLLCYLIYAHPP